MSLMSMLQSPTEVGLRAALLQHYNVVINPRIYFFSIFCRVHPPKKRCTPKGATEIKSRAYIRIKKYAHGREFHIAGASMFDLASNVS